MLNRFLTARNHLATQILFTVFCCWIAFLLVGYPLIMTGSLYHDHATIYSFYRNSFLSVLHFGEIRWWDPTIQNGFPSYYFSFLGLYAATPLFWLTEGALFVLHSVGVRDINIQMLLTLYTAFFIPLLFSLSFLCFTRQIFRSSAIIYITSLLAAFSPCVIYSTSEITFEMTAYGMFTAAALLAFVRKTTTEAYLALNLALCVLLISFNHLSLFWNLLFLVMFSISLLIFPEKKFSIFVAELTEIPLNRHVLFVLSLVVCLLPTILCYLDGSEIYRTAAGKRSFDPLTIYGGSPLEFLLAGIPGAGISRTAEFLTGFPVIIPSSGYVEYLYLGALTLPLAFVGLVYGQAVWRNRLYLLLAFFSVAVLLGGNSAVLGILYLPETPLRSVRHFGDTTFRNGLFALVIIAAGLGVEALVASRAKKIRGIFFSAGLFWLLTIAGVAASALFLGRYHGNAPGNVPVIGYMMTVCFFYLPFVCWIYLKAGMGRNRLILLGIIIFLDLSCTMYQFERLQVLPQAIKLNETLIPFDIGNRDLAFQEDTILALKDTERVVQNLPYVGLSGQLGVMSLDMNVITSMSYNSMELNVSSDDNVKLFWRDSWFKWWRASVNGKEVPVERFMGAFKAVALKPGASKVRFEFRPAWLVRALVVGWGTVMILTVCLLGTHGSLYKMNKGL
jgi:hypothetical protein